LRATVRFRKQVTAFDPHAAAERRKRYLRIVLRGVPSIPFDAQHRLWIETPALGWWFLFFASLSFRIVFRRDPRVDLNQNVEVGLEPARASSLCSGASTFLAVGLGKVVAQALACESGEKIGPRS
jgi:hypothetical protein